MSRESTIIDWYLLLILDSFLSTRLDFGWWDATRRGVRFLVFCQMGSYQIGLHPIPEGQKQETYHPKTRVSVDSSRQCSIKCLPHCPLKQKAARKWSIQSTCKQRHNYEVRLIRPSSTTRLSGWGENPIGRETIEMGAKIKLGVTKAIHRYHSRPK